MRSGWERGVTAEERLGEHAPAARRRALQPPWSRPRSGERARRSAGKASDAVPKGRPETRRTRHGIKRTGSGARDPNPTGSDTRDPNPTGSDTRDQTHGIRHTGSDTRDQANGIRQTGSGTRDPNPTPRIRLPLTDPKCGPFLHPITGIGPEPGRQGPIPSELRVGLWLALQG